MTIVVVKTPFAEHALGAKARFNRGQARRRQGGKVVAAARLRTVQIRPASVAVDAITLLVIARRGGGLCAIAVLLNRRADHRNSGQANNQFADIFAVQPLGIGGCHGGKGQRQRCDCSSH